jgi:DNA-binding NtrC family response regulator
LKKSFTGFTPAAAEVLRRYSWPGNIRELKNAIERTMILAPPGEIDAAYLPKSIIEPPTDAPPLQFVSLRAMEERYVNEVLKATGDNKTQAAKILGIHPSSLFRRLSK